MWQEQRHSHRRSWARWLTLPLLKGKAGSHQGWVLHCPLLDTSGEGKALSSPLARSGWVRARQRETRLHFAMSNVLVCRNAAFLMIDGQENDAEGYFLHYKKNPKARNFNLVEGGFCLLLWGWWHQVWCLYDEEVQRNVLWGQCSSEHIGIVSLHVGNGTVPHVAHLMSWVILTDIDGLSPFPSPHWGCKIEYSTVAQISLCVWFFFRSMSLTSRNMTYHDALS